MDRFMSCVCGEYRPAALHVQDGRAICYACSGYGGKLPQAVCTACGRVRPCEMHHVYGRALSRFQVPLCINCHRVQQSQAGYKNIARTSFLGLMAAVQAVMHRQWIALPDAFNVNEFLRRKTDGQH